MKTISEKLFEQFCKQSNILYIDIPREEKKKTPDYSITLNGIDI